MLDRKTQTPGQLSKPVRALCPSTCQDRGYPTTTVSISASAVARRDTKVRPRQFHAPLRPQQGQQHRDPLAQLRALEHSEMAGKYPDRVLLAKVMPYALYPPQLPPLPWVDNDGSVTHKLFGTLVLIDMGVAVRTGVTRVRYAPRAIRSPQHTLHLSAQSAAKSLEQMFRPGRKSSR